MDPDALDWTVIVFMAGILVGLAVIGAVVLRLQREVDELKKRELDRAFREAIITPDLRAGRKRNDTSESLEDRP